MWHDISIHASAKEATSDYGFVLYGEAISIHASAREATDPSDNQKPEHVYFNPRLRKGGDVIASAVCVILEISIHASAREATPGQATLPAPGLGFQSTPPRGRRPIRTVRDLISELFQSTPPRGRRRRHRRTTSEAQGISIHASAWEATRSNRSFR